MVLAELWFSGGSEVITFFKRIRKKQGKKGELVTHVFSLANFYSRDRLTGQIGESIARHVERYNDRIMLWREAPSSVSPLRATEIFWWRPEFLPVVPVFDFTFRERSVRWMELSSHPDDLILIRQNRSVFRMGLAITKLWTDCTCIFCEKFEKFIFAFYFLYEYLKTRRIELEKFSYYSRKSKILSIFFTQKKKKIGKIWKSENWNI